MSIDILFGAFGTQEEVAVIPGLSRSSESGNPVRVFCGTPDVNGVAVVQKQAGHSSLALYAKVFGIVFGAWARGKHEGHMSTYRRSSEQESLL